MDAAVVFVEADPGPGSDGSSKEGGLSVVGATVSSSALSSAASVGLVAADPGLGSVGVTPAEGLLAARDSHAVSVDRQLSSSFGGVHECGEERLAFGGEFSHGPFGAEGLSVDFFADVGGVPSSGGLEQALPTARLEVTASDFSLHPSVAGSGGELVALGSQPHVEEGSGGELVALGGGGDAVSAAPLRILQPGIDEFAGAGSIQPSCWVLEMVSSFRHLVGVSCDGFESDLMNLFTALEMERRIGSKSSRRSRSKLCRELKALESSVNYEGNVSSSRRRRKAGRAVVNS